MILKLFQNTFGLVSQGNNQDTCYVGLLQNDVMKSYEDIVNKTRSSDVSYRTGMDIVSIGLYMYCITDIKLPCFPLFCRYHLLRPTIWTLFTRNRDHWTITRRCWRWDSLWQIPVDTGPTYS